MLWKLGGIASEILFKKRCLEQCSDCAIDT